MSNPASSFPRRVVFVVLGICVLAVFGVVFTAILWLTRLDKAVDAQVRAIKAAGLPTSGSELNTWYASVPDRENAALVLTQAFLLMRTFPDQRSNEVARIKLPPRGQHLKPEQKDLLSGYVELNAPALAKARESFALAKSRYPVDLTPGVDALLPHLGKIKGLARVADFEAELKRESGRPAEAAAGILANVGLARTLDEEPILVSQLVRSALIKMAVASLERSMTAEGFKDAELSDLATAFTAAERTNLMRRTLIGERAMLMPSFRMSGAAIKGDTGNEEGNPETPSGSPLVGQQRAPLGISGFLERDLNFFLRAMETNIAVLSLPPPQSLAATNLDEQFSLQASRKYYIFSGLFLPSISKISVREADGFARLRTAGTALAIERFRLANGRLPNGLVELTPRFLSAMPIDPFDGASLRYKQLPKGYVVYSVGPDGRDDGGKEFPAKPSGRAAPAYDITITVER